MIRAAWCGVVCATAMTAARAEPPHDQCANAISVSGEGLFTFDSTGATASPDPPPHCDHVYLTAEDFEADVWFEWTPDRTGYTEVSTCGGTTLDTRLAVYESVCDNLYGLLECDDDGCLFQSRVTFHALVDTRYFLRIGATAGLGGGPGTFRIRRLERFPVEPPAPDPSELGCPSPEQQSPALETCQARDRWDAYNSTRGQFECADEFVPEANGTLTGVCWWGTYVRDGMECERELVDFFEITYYADDCGVPGEILAGPFSQEDVTMEVIGPFETLESFPNGAQEYQFSARHDPVEVLARQVYWISITNSYYNRCSWYWGTASGAAGHAVQFDAQGAVSIPTDLAFCFRLAERDGPRCFPTPPENDDCIDALPLSFEGTDFDTSGATTDGPVKAPHDAPIPSACDFPLGDEQIHNDVWYGFEAACTGTVRVDLCESEFDTKLGVYAGAECPPAGSSIACNDDACGGDPARQSRTFVEVVEGRVYTIRVGGYDGAFGRGVMGVRYTAPARTSLRHFADFARCYTGACLTTPCDGLDDLGFCCSPLDIDADGDIDADDYPAFHSALGGPVQ